MGKKLFVSILVVGLVVGMIAPVLFAQEAGQKIGYVDLRRAFYEYEKSKAYDQDLNAVTSERSEERAKKVDAIRKIRDEAEMLKDQARAEKQKELDAKINELNEYDKDTRQELLNKKNDMFREVIEDIQAVVINIGKERGYDYILDSRNIMYAKDGYDLTDDVLVELNK